MMSGGSVFGAPTVCPECKVDVVLQVCRSAAGSEYSRKKGTNCERREGWRV